MSDEVKKEGADQKKRKIKQKDPTMTLRVISNTLFVILGEAAVLFCIVFEIPYAIGSDFVDKYLTDNEETSKEITK